MTREMYEKCKDWSKELKWAVKSSFVHMSQGEFNKIAALYKELYGEALTPSQMTCNTCRLKALVRIGNDFFATEQEIAIEEKDKRIEELKEQGAVIQPEKKKAGRKQKIDIE